MPRTYSFILYMQLPLYHKIIFYAPMQNYNLVSYNRKFGICDEARPTYCKADQLSYLPPSVKLRFFGMNLFILPLKKGSTTNTSRT